MADQILDQADSYASDPTSPWSLLNKMPTKRLDAAISRAAEASIPEQGAQQGGYTPGYAHLSNLPLLPLYSHDQHAMLAKQKDRKDRLVQEMDRNDPDKLLTGGQKTFLSVLGHVSGGVNIVGVKRWERRLTGANVYTSNNLMQQNKLVVFTRWAPPLTRDTRSSPPWFIDVIEHRFHEAAESSAKRMGGNVVMLKVGSPPVSTNAKGKQQHKITLKLLNTEAKGIKSQKTWTKTLNFQPCEAITYVGENEIVALEIVARISRAASTLEANEVQKRFKKEWMVPVIQ